MNMTSSITISVLLSSLVLISPGFGSELPAIVESMGSRHECKQYPKEIHWISEKTSALVVGRSQDSVTVCRLKFGLATAKDGARLRLSFDFMYNHACGVYLQINESFTSDFFSSETNKEMFMSGCNTEDPGPLYAQPKNFVMISLVKDNENLEAYNFRLNISMADHLPTIGPEFPEVLCVGFVLSALVVIFAILLFKYVTRLSYHWHEQQVQETATRAINISNSRECLQEPDRVYATPRDGHTERLRPLDATSNNQRDLTNRKQKKLEARPKSHEPRNHHVIGHEEPSISFQQANIDLESVAAPCLGTDFGDTASLGGCDIPPSYEEALGMPLATDVETDMDNTVGERLDYISISTSEHRENMRERSLERGDTGSNIGTST